MYRWIFFLFGLSTIPKSFTSVIRSDEVNLSSYPKVTRWGTSGTSSQESNEQNRKDANGVPWNHRPDDRQRKLDYVTNNMGVTYYYSKEIPRIEEKSDNLPDAGEVMQSPQNHKPYFSYFYKPQNHANAKADVSDDFKPPGEGSAVDYSSYNHYQNDNPKPVSNLYNSPFTSYNPPKNPSPSAHDFVQYPPNDNPPPVVEPKVPLTELYSPPADSSSDNGSDYPDPTVDSYNTPKPPKGSKPKPPAPVYGPPPVPATPKPPKPEANVPEKPTKPNVYKFPEPFPVPQVFDSNGHPPSATSYGEPVDDDYFNPPSTTKPKDSMKKKPAKPAETYKPPFEIDDGNEVEYDNDDNNKKPKYPSAPRPFHPPLALSDEDDDDDESYHSPKDHGKGNPFLFQPPGDDDDDSGDSQDNQDNDYYSHHHSKPSKPKMKKPPSHDDMYYPDNPMDDSDDSPPPGPKHPSAPGPKHPPSAAPSDMKYPSHPAPPMLMGYPPKAPPMAEGDLSPPPMDDGNDGKHPYFSEDEYEHGHKFNYGPYDYDHHVYHEVTTTTTTSAPPDHRANYSYYFLGRKLWYIPLYFSIYFIIYVTILIIKSIARHKVELVNNFDFTTARSARQLHDLNNIYSNISSTIENVGKKYM